MGTIIQRYCRSKQLCDADLSLLMKFTQLPAERITNKYNVFLKYNRSGRISKSKFVRLFNTKAKNKRIDKIYEYLFRTFDTDNRGSLDFVEFVTIACLMKYGEPEEKLKLVFDMFDIDHNGTIDKDEMETIIKAFYDLFGEENRKGENAPAKRVKRLMSQLDVNHDNSITKEEFVQGCLDDDQLRNMLSPDILL